VRPQRAAHGILLPVASVVSTRTGGARNAGAGWRDIDRSSFAWRTRCGSRRQFDAPDGECGGGRLLVGEERTILIAVFPATRGGIRVWPINGHTDIAEALMHWRPGAGVRPQARIRTAREPFFVLSRRRMVGYQDFE